MTDTIALRSVIAESGLKYKALAEIMGLSPYTLQMKIDNESEFKASEIDALANALGMDMQQRDSIFFCRKSGIQLHIHSFQRRSTQKDGERMTFAQFKKAIPGIKRKMQGWPYKVIIVDGPQGPTGKTTAAKILRDQGLPVYEDWEVLHITLDALLPEWQENAEKR